MLRTQKRALRKSMTSLLHSFDVLAVKEQSRAVTSKLLLLPALQNCSNISCFLSMSSEVDTSEIVSQILKSGNKTLFVPKIATDGTMEFLKVYGQDDLDKFPSGLWDIREPPNECEGNPRTNAMDVGLDLILMPGVAFDRSMSRLGHGKGYYDKYIAQYVASGRPRPVLVALGLREQLLESTIPVDEYDCKMDIVITPDEVLESP